MEKVRKTFFNPLVTSKAEVKNLLQSLPVGSAHPFSPEKILLYRTENGVSELDISSYSEDFFFSAVDLGEMGEVLLGRMAGFDHLKTFEDFQIMQAPDATFQVPISNDMTIIAVSQRYPTYWDLCLGDAQHNTSCFNARNTLPGFAHSGDLNHGSHLLHHLKINSASTPDGKEICVFISGYHNTRITRFLGTHPALMVADHEDKILYIVPVPLDEASIGEATICCPLVIKRDGDSLICSILPTATTDKDKCCEGGRLDSAAFPEAIARANFTLPTREETQECAFRREALTKVPKKRKLTEAGIVEDAPEPDTNQSFKDVCKVDNQENAILATYSAVIPSFLNQEKTQVIRFGTGLEFVSSSDETPASPQSSAVVLPCVFGSELQGPVLLATGTTPLNTPFSRGDMLLEYYRQLKSVVVIVDERMSDNARNLASNFRINALFIIQLTSESEPKDADAVISLMNSANINAVTALAGPQSLVLAQIHSKYYFYRGIANREHLNTSELEFGADLTSWIHTANMDTVLDPRIKRIINMADANSVILPVSEQFVQPRYMPKAFEDMSIEQIHTLEADMAVAVPQLQVLLNQKELQELSGLLIATLSEKIGKVAAPLRERYTKFLTTEYDAENRESKLEKENMLGALRKVTKDLQKDLEPVISLLANMVSAQTTSKRTHDLKRLVRQTTIQNNVEAAKSMTFEKLSAYLETYACDMGVMLLNIDTTTFEGQLGSLTSNGTIDAGSCCALDSRLLHLEGFDAGIIIEQSQSKHNGPLKSIAGAGQPIMALPYLSTNIGEAGSMIAWVCWDEFVNLKSPYTVRWMEKCNDSHIAALRIIMRGTLSQAVASRKCNLQSNAPEIGTLMTALLMAAMSKLAAMRTSAPVELKGKAEDTVTRLMRGLFGNLLTIAGSGVRPLSMVWQLFGLHPQYDLPNTEAEWLWYETVVRLYPYTGWPLAQFHSNLGKLLDKAIIRIVTKNEDTAKVKATRIDEMIRFCKLRNIQLDHSRSIVTVLMRMLSEKTITSSTGAQIDIDISQVATRLLSHLPHSLEKQSESYTKMIEYLTHLSKGGERVARGDLTAINVYTQRSAAFGELKKNVQEAYKEKNWEQVKISCKEIIEKQSQIAALFQVPVEKVTVQNIGPYKALMEAELGGETEQKEESKEDAAKKRHQPIGRIHGDAEIKRVPWQVGKKGEYGDIEPLDETFVQEMLTGEQVNSSSTGAATNKDPEPESPEKAILSLKEAFEQFKGPVKTEFIHELQTELSAEQVCAMMNVSVSAMRVFVRALNPEFVWEDLGLNFRKVVLDLLKGRSDRVESRPVRKLLLLDASGKGEKLQIQE